MDAQLITNVRIVEPGRQILPGQILIHGGRIAAVGSIDVPLPPDATSVDGQGRLLTPGLIDVHTHGVMQFIYECGPDALLSATLKLGQFGVTCAVPTIVPRVEPALLEKLEQIADAIPSVRGVRIPGLHLEGPFVAITGAACATVKGDMGLLEELISACRGRVSVMSVSPETPNVLSVIKRLRELGIRVFLTHTCASVEETQAAIDAGATHATHFYDVFPAPPESDPGVRPVGVVETVLAHRRATVDFIADGVHVHPMAIRAAVAVKGYEGVVLITDASVGAGLPPGEYDTPWGYRVRVRDGDAARHSEKNYLSGSTLTMNQGMANLLKWLDLPAEKVWAMGTKNPARLLGLKTQGSLEIGMDADMVLWDEDLLPVRTWVGGECVYAREETAV